MRCCGWIKHCFLNRLTWKVFLASPWCVELLTATCSCHMWPHKLTVQYILSLSLSHSAFSHHTVSSSLFHNTGCQLVWHVWWGEMCVCLACICCCPRWHSTRCPVCEYRDPASLSHTTLACQHALSHLAHSQPVHVPDMMLHTRPVCPFFCPPPLLSLTVWQWPHCSSELLQMARAQIASAFSHPSQATALWSSSAGLRALARSFTLPPLPLFRVWMPVLEPEPVDKQKLFHVFDKEWTLKLPGVQNMQFLKYNLK